MNETPAPDFAALIRATGVGWAKRSVPTIFLASTWWARRKCAFAHPTDSNFIAMTARHTFAFSPHAYARGMPDSCLPPPEKGAGNAGRSMRPTVSCARWGRRRTRAYRSHRLHPAFPTQWFYGLLRALPGEPGFFATVVPKKLSLPRNLTPASGCQDHTTSPSASVTLVLSDFGVHRIPPRVDDVGQRPLVGRDGKVYRVICDSAKQKYFSKWGLTRLAQNSPSGKSPRLTTASSPDGAKRNPGPPHRCSLPDCASLHPGYDAGTRLPASDAGNS
jgi:hypothetical protein